MLVDEMANEVDDISLAPAEANSPTQSRKALALLLLLMFLVVTVLDLRSWNRREYDRRLYW